MAIKEYSPDNTIDLSGEQGNVFYLMGTALRLAKTLEKDGRAIVDEMKTADYLYAVHVFDREFGDFVTLKLPKGMTAKDIENAGVRAQATPEVVKKAYLR